MLYIDSEGMDVLVVEAPLPVNNIVWRLPTVKAYRDLAVLLLTLVTSSGCLAIAAGRTTADSDALVVRGFVVG